MLFAVISASDNRSVLSQSNREQSPASHGYNIAPMLDLGLPVGIFATGNASTVRAQPHGMNKTAGDRYDVTPGMYLRCGYFDISAGSDVATGKSTNRKFGGACHRYNLVQAIHVTLTVRIVARSLQRAILFQRHNVIEAARNRQNLCPVCDLALNQAVFACIGNGSVSSDADGIITAACNQIGGELIR